MDQNYYFWKTPKSITKKIQKTITKKITKSKKTEKMITKNRGKDPKRLKNGSTINRLILEKKIDNQHPKKNRAG